MSYTHLTLEERVDISYLKSSVDNVKYFSLF